MKCERQTDSCPDECATREHLNQLRRNLAFHIREDHGGGVVPVSCHPCGTDKQKILYDEEDLRDCVFRNRNLLEN